MTFEERWIAGRERGMFTGNYSSGDPFTSALWYHAGQADMAREFAAGSGAMLAMLERIEKAIQSCADVLRAAPVIQEPNFSDPSVSDPPYKIGDIKC